MQQHDGQRRASTQCIEPRKRFLAGQIGFLGRIRGPNRNNIHGVVVSNPPEIMKGQPTICDVALWSLRAIDRDFGRML